MKNENSATVRLRMTHIGEYLDKLDNGTNTNAKNDQRKRRALQAGPTASKSQVREPTTATTMEIANTRAVCREGTFRLPEVVISQAPQSLEVLQFDFEGLDSNGIPKPFIVNPPMTVLYSRKCRSGEEQTEMGTCKKCSYGFYLISAPDRVVSCK